MPKFEKGQPKPPQSGRKKGTPNKKSTVLLERLSHHGCEIDKSLADAIMSKDVELIKALQSILPFFFPKFKDADSPATESSPEDKPTTDDIPTAELIALAKNDA